MESASRICLALAMLASASGAAAEQLRDPTRPASFVGSAPRTVAVPRSGLVLQTVLISPERQAAVISGRLLVVGDSISGLRLSEVREGAVVLLGRDGTRTLRLFPAVEVATKITRDTNETNGSE